MGAYTFFTGEIKLAPPLNEHEITTFRALIAAAHERLKTRTPGETDHPDSECRWDVADDGETLLPPDEMGKHYCATEWLQWLVAQYAFGDRCLNGNVYAETEGEHWKIAVRDNDVREYGAVVVYGDGDGLDDL